ncbi:hypothetical protein BU15DRAFT_88660 [Melanogaster broomeanus]|nr:hypothetical protein BU15DRAFT_88660 [Melanogaster broomeanus]
MAYNRDWEKGKGHHNQGRDSDYSHDYSNDDRHGKGFQSKKRLVPSKPSLHVIFLGLDPDFSEADLQAYLSSNGCNIQTVTIIRDRSSGTWPIHIYILSSTLTFSGCWIFEGISKGFGLAQFTSVEHARAFALESGLPHNGRRVKIDYSQSASPHDKSRRQNMNDGTRDIGNAPAAVLLFRGLDPLSGPQAIAQAMMGSAGPGREGHKGMKRIILIKDKVTMASFQFAFIEFVDIQAASTVLANSMSPQIHPSVKDYMLRDETAITSSLNLGGVENTFVKYWDESATIALLEFKVDEPVPVAAAAATKEKEKKKKVKDDATTKPPAPSALPVSGKPVTLNFKTGTASNKPVMSLSKAPPPLSLGFSAEDFAAGDEDAGPAPAAEDDEVTATKKVAPLIASKKTANNIQKWIRVPAELKEGSIAQVPVPAVSLSAPPSHPPIVSNELSRSSFSDTIAITCLLCARQFKAIEQLKRHNKESDLHKARLSIPFRYESEALRDLARQKVEAARKGSVATVPEAERKYHGRAEERRIMHNQPDPPPPTSLAPGKDGNNVGNKPLKMMGWKEGSGLGTECDDSALQILTRDYSQMQARERYGS